MLVSLSPYDFIFESAIDCNYDAASDKEEHNHCHYLDTRTIKLYVWIRIILGIGGGWRRSICKCIEIQCKRRMGLEFADAD